MEGAQQCATCPQGETACGLRGDGRRIAAKCSGWPGGSRDLDWPNGDFWMFGGSGYDASGSLVLLNDLRDFNPSTKEGRGWAVVSSNRKAVVTARKEPLWQEIFLDHDLAPVH